MNTNTQIDKIDKVLSKISGKEIKAFVWQYAATHENFATALVEKYWKPERGNYKEQVEACFAHAGVLVRDSDTPNWTVEDSTDLNYGLRVLEGWMKQAHVYIEGNNYAYAHFIASSIVFSGANYSDWYIADYPKQATRMKKIVRDGFEVAM